MAQKLVVNFIKIISELQTSFHKELSGNSHIAELIHMDSLKSVKELEKLIADLSMAEEVVDTSFWESIFNRNDVSLQEYINLIQQIISKPTSIMTAMSTNIKSNICCQTLMALSKDFIIIEKNSEAYNRALSMIYDLITSSYLSNENFKFMEKFMMEAILSKNYCLGVNCLLIFIRYLQHLTNPNSSIIIISYCKYSIAPCCQRLLDYNRNGFLLCLNFFAKRIVKLALTTRSMISSQTLNSQKHFN